MATFDACEEIVSPEDLTEVSWDDTDDGQQPSMTGYFGSRQSRISSDGSSQISPQHTEKFEIKGRDMIVITGPVNKSTFVQEGARNTETPQPSSPTESEYKYLQQQVTMCYKKTTGTIPTHPLDPSRTVSIDEFLFDLELIRELHGKHMSHEQVELSGERVILDKAQKVSLDTWEDLFRPEIMKNDKVLLSGEAGFGKSTLLLRVANASIVRNPKSPLAKFKIVFLVKLRQMTDSSCIVDAIFEQILPLESGSQKTLTKVKLKQLIVDNEANFAFLLDGLDEIPSDVLKSTQGLCRVQDILENRVLRKSVVLITTRPHMVDYVLKGNPNIAQVETLGFTSETVSKYVTSYFVDDDSSGEALLLRLKSNQSLRTLAQIPIISLFLCIVWKNQSQLPERLTALYTDFVEVLVKRRCGEGKGVANLKESVLRGLGQVALNGLLDPQGERLIFSSDEFDESVLEDGCRLGFLQQESFTDGLKKRRVVTFLHKSFQEYCAAYYLAKNYHVTKGEFRGQLKKIGSDNVNAMESLLRFTCGTSSESEGTSLILQHLRKMKGNKKALQRLARLLLFESSADRFVGKLERPTDVSCSTQEDLLSFHYYLQSVSPPLRLFRVNFIFHCKSYEDLQLLKDILLGGKIKPPIIFPPSRSLCVYYTISERGNEEMRLLDEILGSMDGKLHDKLELTLEMDKTSSFESECPLQPLHWIPGKVTVITLRDRSFIGVTELINRLKGCRLKTLRLACLTDFHSHVADLRPLVSVALRWLELYKCGLDDDDVPDLNRILPVLHYLECLNLDGNVITSKAKEKLRYTEGFHELYYM